MIIYKRRRIFDFTKIQQRRFKSFRTIDGVKYYSCAYKNDINYNSVLFASDGVNTMSKKFLCLNHYFVSYEFNYRKDKDYDDVTKQYLLLILEPTSREHLNRSLFDTPCNWDIFKVNTLLLVPLDELVSTRILGVKNRLISHIIVMLIYIILLIAIGIISLIEKNASNVLIVVRTMFPLFIIYTSWFNLENRLFGSLNVVFDIPFYTSYLSIMKIMLILASVLLSTLFAIQIMTGLQTSFIEKVIWFISYAGLQTSMLYTFFKKLCNNEEMEF